jgi:hypothetical protein
MANVPTSSGFSQASAGARITGGKSGIRRKTDYVVLFKSASGGPIVVPATWPGGNAGKFFSGRVECPSGRVRVAFGISARYDDPAAGTFGAGSYWNVTPKVKVASSPSPAGAKADTEDYYEGRPLFYVCPPSLLDAGGTDMALPPPYTDPSVGFTPASFQSWQQNQLFIAQSADIGRALPDSYEAVSAANRYDIHGIFAPRSVANDILYSPIVLWASWEVVDPRDGEDTEALLAECSVSAPRTIVV